MFFNAKALGVFLTSSLLMASCQNHPEANRSATKVVDIEDSQIKWQSIGNCWLYAYLGWVESLELRSGLEEKNYSETYMTYRHFQSQFSPKFLSELPKEVTTGGRWASALRLTRNFGLALEGDFVPSESEDTFSLVQMLAQNKINAKLKDEEFRSQYASADTGDRQKMVTELLDEAFGVNMAEFEASGKVIQAKDVKINDLKGNATTLAEEAERWSLQRWPYSSAPAELPGMSPEGLNKAQESLLKKVKAALNRGEPVVMNWFVDFNAQDEEGVFTLEHLKENGPGRQGYHQTVIEDYVVEATDPETGDVIEIAEGDVSSRFKKMALEYGRIKYFVVKNSWGGEERKDRPSYSRFGKKGYAKLSADYLFGHMEAEDSWFKSETGLTGFIFPDEDEGAQ